MPVCLKILVHAKQNAARQAWCRHGRGDVGDVGMICALDFSDSDEGLHHIPCFGGRHGEPNPKAHKQAKKSVFLGLYSLAPKTVTRR